MYFCAACNVYVNEQQASEHDQSIAHMMSTSKQPSLRKVWIPDTNRGYQLLSTMGWSEGRGLGANEQGTTTPVRTHLKLNRAGIGHGEMGKSRVTHFPAHDERQQQTSADGLSDAQRMQERLMRKRSSELDKLTKAERKARQLKDQRKEQKIGRELYAPHLEGYEEYFQ